MRHAAREPAVHRGVLEQVGPGYRVGQVVDGDKFERRIPKLAADDAAADTAETIDGDTNGHGGAILRRGRVYYESRSGQPIAKGESGFRRSEDLTARLVVFLDLAG